MPLTSSPAMFSMVQKIRFGHTDPAGIVYYPHYFDLFNEVVEDFFEEWAGASFQKLKEEHRVITPLRHVECDFSAPSRIGDRMLFSLSLVALGRTSITLTIEGSVDGEIRVRGRLVHVFISVTEGQPVPPPSIVAERMKTALAASTPGSETSGTGCAV